MSRHFSSKRPRVIITVCAAAVISVVAITGLSAAQAPKGVTDNKTLLSVGPSRTPLQVTAGPPSARIQTVYDVLREQSEASKRDPAKVQQFVDTIFGRTGFPDAARTIKARVVRSELAYRHGFEKPVTIATFVRAMNTTVEGLPVPAYFRTSRSQVLLQELFVQAHAPKGLWDNEDDPELLSPSEATFFALFLAYQKFFNPTYQRDPDDWSSWQHKLIENHPDPAFLRARANLQPKDRLMGQYRDLRRGLTLDNGDAAAAANKLFDRLGFAR